VVEAALLLDFVVLKRQRVYRRPVVGLSIWPDTAVAIHSVPEEHLLPSGRIVIIF
jgi:hypothetical protein